MPRRKKNIIRLQDYNKRRRLSFEEKETNENNIDSIESEDEKIVEKEKTRTRLLAALIWNEPEKNKRTIKGVPKTTYYRKFGTFGVLANASKGTPKITSFWGNCGSAGGSFVPSPSPSPPESPSKTDEISTFCEKVAQLRDGLIKNGKTLTAFEYNRQHAVYEYLIRLNDGRGKMKASKEAAQIVYIISKPYTAKWIRSLAKFYLNHKSFPVSCRGKHQKYDRLVDDEDVALSLQQWLRQESGSNGIDVAHFKQYIEDFILPERVGTRKTISIRTAERWLHILGYRFEGYRKGVYFDGYEREDVIIYRKNFLEIMKELEPRMARYEGEEMEVIQHLNQMNES